MKLASEYLTAQLPDLRSLAFDHKSFAVTCPPALAGFAFYPILVHQLTP